MDLYNYINKDEFITKYTSILYGINTLGAVIGAFFVFTLFVVGIVYLTRLIIKSAPAKQEVAGEHVLVEWTPERKEALAKFSAERGALLYS